MISYNSGTGELTYTPNADFNGTENLTYTLSDEHGESVTGIITITVTQVLEPPRAQDDTAGIGEDETSVTINVLDNDYDSDSDSSINASPTDPTLTITSITTPSPSGCGTAQIVADTVVFYPAADFDTVATIEYTIENSTGRIDTATITILMTEYDDNPVAQDVDTEVFEDSSVQVDLNNYINDIDTGDVLGCTIEVDCENGVASIDEDNVLTYTPDANFNGEDSITFKVSDRNSLSDTAVLDITVKQVNDAPLVQPDEASGNEDTDVTILLLANDSDIDTEALLNARPDDEWLQIDPTGFDGLDNGEVKIVYGYIVYTPNENWHGIEEFTYTAIDQSGVRVQGEVTVTILPVNDIPEAIDDYENVLDEENQIVYKATELVFDPDIESIGDVLVYSIVSQPGNGSLVLDSEDKFTYTPDKNYNGFDEFTIKAVDKDGAELITVIEVHVNQVNDKPVARDVLAKCDEDTSVTIDVLASATDVDQTTMLNEFPKKESLSIVEGSFEGPAHGTVELVDGMIVYTPDKDYRGEDAFDYKVRDRAGRVDTATAVVIVNSILDVPVILEFTTPLEGNAYKSGQEVLVQWTVENPENVDIVYTLEFFDGTDWVTVETGLTSKKLGHLIEDYITQTDEAQYGVIGYYDGTPTNKVFSDLIIVDNVAPINTKYEVFADTEVVRIKFGVSDDMIEYEYLYAVDGGDDMILVSGNEIVVGDEFDSITLCARDALGNFRDIITISISDALLAARGTRGGVMAISFTSHWWILLLGFSMLLALLLLLMYRNIIFEFTYADGRTKTVKKLRRYRKEGISTALKKEYFEGATGISVTLMKRITRKMQSNTVTISKGDEFVKEVVVPSDAIDRFEDVIF